MGKERTGWVNRLVARLEDRFAKPKRADPSLIVEADGFAYVWPDEKRKVAWAEVKEVFAFKRDLFSVDLICVGFRTSDDGPWSEIDEQMAGYKDVLDALPKAFPGIATDWWEKVAYPAFKTNLQTLWGEPKIASIWMPRST